MNPIQQVLGVVLVCVSAGVSAQPANSTQARSLAASCANCHGTDGRSEPGHAWLAGMSRAELLGKLQAFKSGATPSTVMQQLAKGYTDAQLEALAGYFAAMPVQKGGQHAAP